jgi:hypothetical protein
VHSYEPRRTTDEPCSHFFRPLRSGCRCNRDYAGCILRNIMLSMRILLSSDPFLPREVREVINDNPSDARKLLVSMGINECEAAELLGDHRWENTAEKDEQ